MAEAQQLLELEAIKRLKYRYMRCLDLKLWDEIGACFSADATCSYAGGRYAYAGREAIVGFLRGAMGPELVTVHHVHHPEIEFTGPARALGSWALEDTVIHTGQGFTLRGAAFYQDEYVKLGGEWKIRATGYERIYEEVESRQGVPGLRLTANRWGRPEE